MLKKKKKGSVLLVVVGFFAILSILIVSVLSMTTTGFKLRKDESVRIENFYGADSGIDIAQSESIEVVKKAIEEGDKAVTNSTGSLDYNQKNIIFKTEYKKYINDNLKDRIDNVTSSAVIYDTFVKKGNIVKVEMGQIEKLPSGASEDDVKDLRIALKSNFKDENEKDREVKIAYNIAVPDYGTIAINEVQTIAKSNLLDYLIAADGNLTINNTGHFKAYGDIWVNGTSSNNRFERGIQILGNGNSKSVVGAGGMVQKSTNSNLVQWIGNVVTRGAITMDGTNVDLYGDIFAQDVLLNNKVNINPRKVDVQDSGLNKNLRDFYVYNDLILKGEKSLIKINDYYGLNDIKSFEEINLLDDEKSSSIIVDSKDFGTTSKIEANDVSLLGTAYLGLGETDNLKTYESGESVVINRNTAPYTDRGHVDKLSEDKNNNLYLYDYKKPLHIIDKIYKDNEATYGELSLSDKVDLVESFYKNNVIENTLLEGIQAKSIKGAGVTYNKGKAIEGKQIIDLSKQQKRFVEEVYLRNSADAEMPKDFWTRPEEVTVMGSVNWNAISKIISSDSIYEKIGTNDVKIFDRKYKDDSVAIFSTEGMTYDTVAKLVNHRLCSTDGKVCVNGNNEEDCKRKCLTMNNITDIAAKRIKLIFNDENSDIVINQKTTENKGNYTNVKVDYNNEIAIIITKGDIKVEMEGSAINSYVVVLTGNNLVYENSSVANIGSFSVNYSTLSNVFKEIFGFDSFDEILGGGDGSNNGVGSESNNVIQANDLINNKKWDLVK
ncbi:MAG: hypothetical protein ACRCX8_18475 [Sarcina sp.]